jgi:hypothetical protein
MVLALNYLQK